MKIRWLPYALVCFSSVFTLGGQDPSPSSRPRPMGIEDTLKVPSIGSVEMSPNGRWVAFVVTEADFENNRNNPDIWVVPTDGGEARQLTRHPGADSAPQWAPDSSWLAFSSDREEKVQVFGIRPDGGEAWQVTSHKTGTGDFRISPDGRSIAFTARSEKTQQAKDWEEQRGRPIVWETPYEDEFSHLWIADLEDLVAKEATQLTEGPLHVGSMVWSPDSRKLAFGARPSPVLRTYPEGQIYVVDRSGSPPQQVTNLPGGENPVEWSEDQGIIFSGSGHALGTYNSRLWSVPGAGGEPVTLTGHFDEDAGFVHSSADTLLVEAAAKTGRGLYRISISRQSTQRLTGEDSFQSQFSASWDGRHLAFLSESGEAGPEIHYRAPDGSERKLTSIFKGYSDFLLGEQSVVSWQSKADGETIEGVLTLPVGYQQGHRVPLLLVIHGGPSGVSSNRFGPRRGPYPIQVFAGQGYAILQPNYRGSTGYGERFRGLNRGDISGRDWIDIDSGVDHLVDAGIADPDRLGIMGWSFGGHHTYWGITQTQRFKAASAGAGANDLISMYSQTDIPEFYHTYLGPKPWEDFNLYEERSAYRFVERVTTPLLIQVGEKDERVPAEQSIQFHLAVKAIGKAPTELVVYPGQPHGVRAPRLVRDLMIRNVEWFSKWIPVEQVETGTASGSSSPGSKIP